MTEFTRDSKKVLPQSMLPITLRTGGAAAPDCSNDLNK